MSLSIDPRNAPLERPEPKSTKKKWRLTHWQVILGLGILTLLGLALYFFREMQAVVAQ